MTTDERAAQLWSLLVLAAHNQQLLSYKTIARLTGINRAGVGKMLGPITRHCWKRKLPVLTCIAVAEGTGLPGKQLAGKNAEDLLREQSRVFVFDWINQGNPF